MMNKWMQQQCYLQNEAARVWERTDGWLRIAETQYHTRQELLKWTLDLGNSDLGGNVECPGTVYSGSSPRGLD